MGWEEKKYRHLGRFVVFSNELQHPSLYAG